MLLFPQNTGQNQPLRTFQFWQDLDQQFAEEICCNDVDPLWKFPFPDVRDSEIDLFDLVSPRVFFRRRDCDRIVIDRNYPLRSEACRCQCQNSRSRPQIEQRKFLVWHAPARAALRASHKPLSSQALQRSQRHRRRHVLARPKRRSRGNHERPLHPPARGGRDDNQPFPYLQRLGFLPTQKFPQPIARQFLDYSTKSPPNLLQLRAVRTRNFRDRIPMSRFGNNCEPPARNFMLCHLVGSEPAGAGPLSPNEHQPNTRKLFLFRSFGFLLRRYFLR